MREAVELIPLSCVRCGTAVPAVPDEVAWMCATCGQGLLLHESSGVQELDVRHAVASQQSGLTWRPFWVTVGRVSFKVRETYGRDRGPDELWREQQTFILPAFECSLDEAGMWGMGFLRQPPRLVAGPPGVLERVTVDPHGARALAEFVVLTVEAERRDHLRRVELDLGLEPPTLWGLPFTGPSERLELAIAA